MKLNIKCIGAGLTAVLLLSIPATASANRTYVLLGVRHMYVVGDDPNLYAEDREEIEKTYADCVASDFATAESRIAGGATATEENRLRNGDLEKLAEDRDECLDELYETRDDLRDNHPELKLIDIDGPYQLVAIDFHAGRDSEGQAQLAHYRQQETIDAVTVLAPWQGYTASKDSYGGWVYGKRYEASQFVEVWRTWRGRHRGKWSLIAYRGHAGALPFERGRFTGRAEEYVVERGYMHARGRLHKKGVKRRKGHTS